MWFLLSLAGCGLLGACLGGLACWGRGAQARYGEGWEDSAAALGDTIAGLRGALAEASATLAEVPGPPPAHDVPVTTAPCAVPVLEDEGRIGGPGLRVWGPLTGAEIMAQLGARADRPWPEEECAPIYVPAWVPWSLSQDTTLEEEVAAMIANAEACPAVRWLAEVGA